MLLFFPILLAVAYLVGGQTAMAFVGLAFPVTLAFALPPDGTYGDKNRDALTGLTQREGVVDAANLALAMSRRLGWSTGIIMVEIDKFRLVEERYDHAMVNRIVKVTAERICDSLRDADIPARIDNSTFAIALSPVRRLDLEVVIQMAGRIQRSVAEPISVEGTNAYVTVSVGFSLAARLNDPSGESLMQAATAALIEAQRNGPSAIRSYSLAMRDRIKSRNSLSEQVADALENGEIKAFYQPQISIGTGAITGFETLARWHHPERGLIPPAEFLPALEHAGLMDRLGELMVTEALSALKYWDDIGIDVPRVSVNFSSDELCNPRLVERIGWELDKFDLTPDRLVVEVLETVVASRSDDVVIRNLASLARLGCCLDLDDFGTGHASITSIRRFSIERIKIDRSFVTRIDEDPEQQKMVSAILTMADRLGLDTLAEGVETPEEQEMLMKLGCGHIQGFALARPMPLAETQDWIETYLSRHSPPPARHLKVI
ncbi:putative bifunctional diguanylate cyclase/phosphodiesterase [Flavimaricola marinus]|nr:bifunctional diguanylate cyclase/phosphodiesterase [Flavimaricola marinus]